MFLVQKQLLAVIPSLLSSGGKFQKLRPEYLSSLIVLSRKLRLSFLFTCLYIQEHMYIEFTAAYNMYISFCYTCLYAFLDSTGAVFREENYSLHVFEYMTEIDLSVYG